MGTATKITDNHRFNPLTNIDYIIKQNSLMSKLGLNYASFRDMIAIYNNYITTDSGLKVYRLLKMFGLADANYCAVFQRLNVLQAKGLIINVNRTYIPTSKAIDLLNSLS